jgi:8-oxo-dGTP pyrophosphatase MutT (NUDIX family)
LPGVTRIVCFLLVDPRGRLLMQEKDEHARRGANQWGAPGGHVEDGEDFEAAAYREITEETGLELPPGSLRLWLDDEFTYVDTLARYQFWVAPVDWTDGDIVVGEGRQIVFVDPEQIPGLDLWASAAHFLPQFLDSSAYSSLRKG